MDRIEIPIERFSAHPHDLWNKPFVQVVVRPSRFTFQFMEKFNSFTLSVLPESHREVLQLLGSRSGRDGDKIHDSGLTPIPSDKIDAPGFEEYRL